MCFKGNDKIAVVTDYIHNKSYIEQIVHHRRSTSFLLSQALAHHFPRVSYSLYCLTEMEALVYVPQVFKLL